MFFLDQESNPEQRKTQNEKNGEQDPPRRGDLAAPKRMGVRSAERALKPPTALAHLAVSETAMIPETDSRAELHAAIRAEDDLLASGQTATAFETVMSGFSLIRHGLNRGDALRQSGATTRETRFAFVRCEHRLLE